MDNQSSMVIGDSVRYRTVYGTNLAVAREGLRDAAGRTVTQAVFAAVCGYSQPYQAELEQPGAHEVPAETAGRIAAAIAYFQKKRV